jgi:hypothetical protein
MTPGVTATRPKARAVFDGSTPSYGDPLYGGAGQPHPGRVFRGPGQVGGVPFSRGLRSSPPPLPAPPGGPGQEPRPGGILPSVGSLLGRA